MQRLLEFIKRIYVVLVFIVLEGVALWFYATSTPYHEAKILSRTTAVGGAVSGMVTSVAHFFSLPSENRMLTERIAQLEERLGVIDEQQRAEQTIAADSLISEQWSEVESHFRYHSARVISMTTGRMRNHIIVDRGSVDGVGVNMGVITPDRELVGYVIDCTEQYAVVLPMLSTDFGIGGTLVDNGYSCSVHWDGRSPYKVELVDLSTYAEPRVGMAVDVRSERLPEGVLIGHIESFELNATQTAYTAVVELAVDISAVDNLLIVENTHYGEIETLMEQMDQ